MASKRQGPGQRSRRVSPREKGNVPKPMGHVHLYESQCPRCHPEILPEGHFERRS